MACCTTRRGFGLNAGWKSWLGRCLGVALVCIALSAQAREITCYSDVFAPYVVSDGDAIRGIDVDAVREAGRRVGLEVHFKLLPWVRLEREIASGADTEVACAFAYTLTDARKLYMDYTTVPLKLTELVLFVQKGALPSFRSFDDLKGKRVGIRRGFKMPAPMQAMVSQGDIELEESNQDDANFEKLARGRVFAILSNRDVGQESLERIGQHNVVGLAPAVQVTPTYLVLNKAKGLADLVPLFDKGLRAIAADGTTRAIRKRYVETSSR